MICSADLPVSASFAVVTWGNNNTRVCTNGLTEAHAFRRYLERTYPALKGTINVQG